MLNAVLWGGQGTQMTDDRRLMTDVESATQSLSFLNFLNLQIAYSMSARGSQH